MDIPSRSAIIIISILFLVPPHGPGEGGLYARLAAAGPRALPSKYEPYEDRWKAVAGFEEKDRPRSALEETEKILALAKKSRNAPQIVKAQIHRIKYLMAVGEREHPDILRMLEGETAASVFPEKQILQSLLAEAYWNYFSANRYLFYRRTETAGKRDDDIATWSPGALFGRVIELYRESLMPAGDLKKVPLGLVDDIIVKGNVSRSVRPTLYDFLAHRAVDFFTIDENQLTRPSHDFEIDSAEYFADAGEFVRLKAVGNDSSSLRYQAVLILQELTRLHMDNPASEPGALVDVELKRLTFMREKSIIPDKDDCYLAALMRLERKHAGHPASALVTCAIARWYAAQGNAWKEGDPADHRWSIKKSRELALEAMRRFPGSEGALLCRPLAVIERGLSLSSEQVNTPKKPFRVLVRYKNIDRIHLRAVRLSKEMNATLAGGSESTEAAIRKLAAIKPAHAWSQALPDDGDLRDHSVEIRVPPLGQGAYAILAGTDVSLSCKGNAAAYLMTRVSNLAFVHRVSAGEGAVMHVYHRATGALLPGVAATISERRYDYGKSRYVTTVIAKLLSDADGYLRVPLKKESARYGSLSVLLEKDGDRLESGFESYAYERSPDAARRAFFFTDRAIYRPGQAVHFKAILLALGKGRRYGVLPDTATTVEFRDQNNRKLSSVSLRSNRYGTVSGSFTAPTGALTGEMTVRNEWGSAMVRVEEYKRPKFEAGFESVKGNYRLGDRITARGYARSYAGAPLTDAKVVYSVVRKTWFPYRWWGWYFRQYRDQLTVMQKGETVTDGTGAFTVSFEAIPDPRIPSSEQPSFHYEVHADVTDINGETHAAVTEVHAGYTSLIVDILKLPGSIDSSKDLVFEVRTANYSGEFVPAKGTVSIARVREPARLLRPRLWDRPDRQVMSAEEYARHFPNDPYGTEDDPRARGTERPVFSASFDTARSARVSPGPISAWPDGEYLLSVDTIDSYGQRIHFERNLSVLLPRTGRSAVQSHLFLTPLTTTVEPGARARLVAGSALMNARLILDIIRPENRTEKKIITLNAGKIIIDIPISESDRGNVHYRYAMVADNRIFTGTGSIHVPWTNRELKAEFMTFRNRLKPGEKEEWRVRIRGIRGETVAAELAATMYDASLDSFVPHGWYFNVNPAYYLYEVWHTNATFGIVGSHLAAKDWVVYEPSYARTYDSLNLYGVYFFSRHRTYRYKSGGKKDTDDSMAFAEGAGDEEKESIPTRKAEPSDREVPPAPSEQRREAARDGGEIQVRRNLSETAFFFPQLRTDEKGDVVIVFTAPEALTRWRMLGIAHTVDMKSTVFDREIVTQKELMVVPNAPRFLREGDTVAISAKVSNLTDAKLTGRAELFLFDAATMRPADTLFGNERRTAAFSVAGKGNAAVSWSLHVPASVDAVTWRIVVRADSFGDGEESTLPVLSDRMLVTESLPLPVRGNETKGYAFRKLLDAKSSATLAHHRLTLEFTSNPAWYAVQALPYLMEFPHECSEQVFGRFYANSLAAHIVSASPRIKAVFDQWKDSAALLSNLQKNEELKSVLLHETPWLLAGKSEEENKKRVALLFDMGRMAKELDGALRKLGEMQGGNGGWPWFAGLPESRYITQHILAGLAKLRALGVKQASQEAIGGMSVRAVAFIDGEMKKEYDDLIARKIRLDQKNINYTVFHYLYTRSFFNEMPVPDACRDSFNYWKGQAAAYWPGELPSAKGMAAIALSRFGNRATAKEIMTSLTESAIHHDELGMYWKDISGGYWWWQAPVETQALLIEAFGEVGRDRGAVDDMRTWLVKMKQVQSWPTTKATTDACYALLMGGGDWLSGDRPVEVYLNNRKVDPAAMGASVEAGTGYFKVAWSGDDVKPEMGTVRVANGNPHPAWGALHWQYFERLDRITPHETPLRLEKRLFLVTRTDRGQVLTPLAEGAALKPGDRVRVRIILRADRDMEYVHMKDMRAAGMEPENVLSSHRYQDGLWYYESTRDAATHFFIERLPKGTYVFEYPLVAGLKGDFSAGIATIQCMYAPEFTSHSAGMRIRVE